MSTIQIAASTAPTTPIGFIWIDPATGRAYYALLTNLQEFLLTGNISTILTWLPDPDGLLHDPTVVGFARYAAEQLANEPQFYVVDYEVLDQWPPSPNVGSKWAPFTALETDVNGDPLAVFWRAVEPDYDPNLPWSQRRIVELYGVVAESQVLAGALTPFPLQPIGTDDAIFVTPTPTALTDNPEWATAWNGIDALAAGKAAVPRAIVGRYKELLVAPGNPIVFQAAVATANTWVDLLAVPKGIEFEISQLAIMNNDPNSAAIEYRFGPLSGTVKVPANQTANLDGTCDPGIRVDVNRPLQVRAATVTQTFTVTAQAFVKNLPPVVEY